LRLSDADLMKGGYPLPPDRERAPYAFETWLDAVTHPVVVVDPVKVASPYFPRKFGVIEFNGNNVPLTSPIWSGVELRGSPGSFGLVQGTWTVPSVTGEANTTTAVSTWVGIDGDSNTPGGSDLAQAGTLQSLQVISGMQVQSNLAFSQLLPNQTAGQVFVNFQPNPHDQIYAQVSIGDAGGLDILPGSYMLVCLEDIQQRTAVVCYLDENGNPSNTGFTPLGTTSIVGDTVEWVIERPQQCTSQSNCPPADLANFGNVSVFQSTLARRANAPRHGGWVNCCGAGSFLMNMTSDGTATGTPLDTVNLNGGTINFDWLAFH
jgi:Peptidase A4 family